MNLTISSLLQEPEPAEDEVRRRAYFIWLDRGCPLNDDWSHWFAAEAAAQPLTPKTTASELTIRHSVTDHPGNAGLQSHATGKRADERVRVAAGEARQRARGRRDGGSLRPVAKKRS